MPEWTQRALTLEPEIARRAERYRFMEHAVVVGRGLNYANAFEFALKLMETCYVVAERFSTADLLHGPIAMLEAGFPAFLFAPAGVTWPGTREILSTLHELKAETMIVPGLDQGNEHIEPIAIRRVALRMHQSFDLLERTAVVALALDRFDFDSLRLQLVCASIASYCRCVPMNLMVTTR